MAEDGEDPDDIVVDELAEETSLVGVPPAPDWLTDRRHPDVCGACGHPHTSGRSGPCSRFDCDCKTWAAPK